jgi:hypothetical protein
MLAIPAARGSFGILFEEKVQAGGGLGWDGQIYAALVAGLPDLLRHGELAPYYAHRILAPALAWMLIRLAGAEPVPAAIIAAFGVLNLLAQIGSAWLWYRIAGQCRIGLPGKWIGYAALFLNFEAAKLAWFYPVLVDSTAIFVSFLLLFLFLKRSSWGLVAATLLASFCWSTGGLTGALLIAFPREPVAGTAIAPDDRWLRYGIAAACLAGLAIYFATWSIGTCGHGCTLVQAGATRLPALAIAAAAAVLLVWPLTLPKFGLRILLALAILGLATAIASAIANPALRGGTSVRLLAHYILLSPQPGKFLLAFVAAPVFWGPLALLTMLLWKRVAAEAGQLGWGMTANLAAALPLALVAEPRFLTFAWPFVTLCTVRALEGRVGRAFAWRFVLLALIASKVWLPINGTAWTGPETAGFAEFPKQIYFMNFGFWMNWSSFLGQAALCLLLLGFFARSFAPSRPGSEGAGVRKES